MRADVRTVAILLVAAATAAIGAGEPPIKVDPARSHADFDVNVLLLFRGRGNFGAIFGEVSVDADGHATVQARIPIASLDMRREDQERWAKGPDFFDAARWPEILFRSDPVPLARLRDGGPLPGRLTIRGTERSQVFELAPAGCERPGHDCPIAASGSMRRSDFALGEGRRTLSDRVRLRFEIMLEQD
ncbi:MAG TPA: YceI family protein [Xanthomonadaceae bacterium]|nr:YceI family protein [Xanthomonadaceae bacterium]